MEVLKVEGITKKYGRITALDQFSLSIEQGSIYGILGPNGSGKTTFLGVVLGILLPNGGSFSWFENQYGDKYRLKIGAILETPNFYPYLNADDNLRIIARIKGVHEHDFDELLELVSLSHRRKSSFQSYSLGMKQRLAIAAALIGNPDVVIFDEPTNGLDPKGISEVREILGKVAGMGKTVIMASHILDEVEKICSHVAIIKNGKLLASGLVGQILGKEKFMEIASENTPLLQEFIENFPEIQLIKESKNVLECSLSENFDLAKFHASLIDRDIYVHHLMIRNRRLEEEFLSLTN
jgi:ABC-2 type transport system ATP-binding protein